MKRQKLAILTCCVAMTVVLLSAASALAAIPATVAVEGVLQAKGGGPAADGSYDFTFTLYNASSKGSALWAESVKLKVVGGAFSHVLGSVTKLDYKKLNAAPSLWLATRIAKDPELPRERVHAVLYAAMAGSANMASGLSCSGCVKASMLAFDGDFNLKNKALTAGKLTSAGDVVAGGTVAAKSFAGDGSKLKGVARANVLCKVKGEVVKGINADGSLKCVKAMDPNALPADGLNEISNNQLTNQFIDEAKSTGAVGIPDNNPAGVVSKINFPDYGIAQALSVSFTISGHKGNGKGTLGIGDLIVSLKDPKGVTYILHNKTGTKQAISATFPPTKLVSGDLSKWHGSNPKGLWELKVIDSGYLDNKIDGKLASWSIKIQTLSNKKVATTGDHYVMGTMFGGVQLKNMTKDPFTCTEARAGYVYFNSTYKSLNVCEGKQWVPINLRPVGSQINPGRSCKDVWTRRPGALDGNFWIDPDGAIGGVVAVQLSCDMKGGGWTKIDQKTSYQTKVYSESSKYYGFSYAVSDAFINALKKVTTAAKQTWKCASKGAGSQNHYHGWNNATYKQSASGTCWHSNNSSTVSGSGTHTSFIALPVRAWQSVDCGDGNEHCSYNVGAVYFK